MLKKEKTGNSPSFDLSAVLAGILLSITIYFLGMITMGTVYHLATSSEDTLPWASAGLFFISVFLGAAFTARRAGRKALYHGICVALVFFMLAWVTIAVFSPLPVSSSILFYKLALALAAGALGSISGTITAG
ncbi:MAG TPA: TIGR04086 family membrane protein [Desulfotomaculum sp.]|jgi:putative membrane protein (TIGR04086 family)|nr:TIGR04086 family membrane protein [Desulfotomaculum sp.]